jgi:hypothetical protein
VKYEVLSIAREQKGQLLHFALKVFPDIDADVSDCPCIIFSFAGNPLTHYFSSDFHQNMVTLHPVNWMVCFSVVSACLAISHIMPFSAFGV